jgi:hypothetical protein
MVSDAYYDTEIDSVWKNNPRPNIYEGTIFHGYCDCCSRVNVSDRLRFSYKSKAEREREAEIAAEKKRHDNRMKRKRLRRMGRNNRKKLSSVEVDLLSGVLTGEIEVK